MPDASLRFVVLRHVGIPDPHYDLMLETTPGGLLQTWRAPDWPIAGPVCLTPLAPHRRQYLTYEGPVADNRGVVTRVAEGTFERSVDEYVLSPVNGRPLHLRLRGDVAEASAD